VTIDTDNPPTYVRFEGRYWSLDRSHGKPLTDHRGHYLLTSLKDHSRGVSANPLFVWPAEPHQVKAIEELSVSRR